MKANHPIARHQEGPFSRNLTRRRFLKAAAASAAIGPLLMTSGKAAPNERVRLGFIACGGRARQLMNIFRHFPDVDIPVICDVIEPRLEEAAKVLAREPYPQTPERVIDYRRMLERDDIDAVVIATTQHWHGLPHIHACQAGKAIFVEKPLSHTVVEGRAMVEAARKHGVLAMMGTQQRAGPHYQKVVELVGGGRLGKVALVECWNYHNTGSRVGHHADGAPPAGYDWDRWLGPAPKVPFNWGRLNNSWWFDYAGGMMTNWAVHHIDIILWAMQAASPITATCSGGKFVVNDMADTPDTIDASWEFPGWLMQYQYRGFNNYHSVESRPHHHGICFHGDKATLVVDRHGYQIWDEADPRQVAEKESAIPYFSEKDPARSEQDGPWQRAFVDCLKQGKPAPLDLEESHRSTVCCHLANISYLTGEKVRWDGKSEKVIGSSAANDLLDRPRREGYQLPKV